MRSGTSTSRTRTRQADEIRDPDVEHAHQAGGREQGPRRRGRPRGPSHTVHTHQFPRRRVGVRKVRVLQGARSRHCSDGRPSITRPHFDAMLSPHDRRFQHSSQRCTYRCVVQICGRMSDGCPTDVQCAHHYVLARGAIRLFALVYRERLRLCLYSFAWFQCCSNLSTFSATLCAVAESIYLAQSSV